MLQVAVDAGHVSSEVSQARALLRSQLQSLQGTVEQLTGQPSDGLNFTTLSYARGADFWCDGANVPYNYRRLVAKG